MMIAGGDHMFVLPRGTIYAATELSCTGVVGLCLPGGSLAHREQSFGVEGLALGSLN